MSIITPRIVDCSYSRGYLGRTELTILHPLTHFYASFWSKTVRTKMLLALAAILAFATSASADFTVSDAGSISGVTGAPRTASGGYFFVPGIGNAGGFLFGGGPFADANFDGATENIGADLGGGFVESSDSITVNGDGTVNVLLTLFSTSGDFAPAGLVDAAGAPLDTFAVFAGASAGGTPINFGGTVNSAFVQLTDSTGADIFAAGGIELVGLGFDIESGSFGVSFGPTAGLGINTVTLDVNVTKAVPEPTSVALLGFLGVGLFTRRRR